MMKSVGILLLFLSTFTVPLFAATEYVVGVGDYDYWPHHGVADNEYQGYAREVLDLFSKESGHTFVYRPLPWKRVVHEYIRGEIDFIYPDNPAWDIEVKKGKTVHYSNAVVAYVDGVVVLPENKGNGISRFKTIGTIRGFDVWEDTNYIQTGQVKVAESDDFGPLLKQVFMKNVDGAYIELAVANYYLREVLKKPGALVFDPDLPFREDSYYLSTIKHPEIIKIFNKFQVTERNAIEALQRKYKVGAATDEITVGVSTGYPPYYYEQEGKLVGACIDLVDSVAQSLGIKITYKQFPWARMLLNAQQGQVDAIMPLFRTEERDSFLYFDKLNLVDEKNSFFTWKENKVQFDGNFETIQPYKVGVVTGYSYGESFDRYSSFNKVTTQNDKHLLEMFKHRRFDVGIGSRDVVMFNAKGENISDQIQFLDPLITEAPLYIGFSKAKGREGLSKRFSVALQRFKLTEEYQAILKKYGMTQ